MTDQAVNYALTTVARVKARIGITETGHDTVLISYVNSVTAFIERQCDKRFKRKTYTNEVHQIMTSGRRWLVLKSGDVVSVSSMQYKAGTPTTPTWTDFNADDYELAEDGHTGLIYFAYAIPRGIDIVRATYVAGYLIDFTNYGDETLHTLPYDITELAERLIVKRFKKRDDEGKGSVSFGGGTTSWDSFLDDGDKDIIASHSRSRSQFV